MTYSRPITDLLHVAEISDFCHEKREPVFLTKNGHRDLVIMSVETYEDLLETPETDIAITEAEAEYQTDEKSYDARDVLLSLKRKYFEVEV